MSIEEYSNWNQRESDADAEQEPYRKYVFICEGENTEVWYFRRLIDLRKTLGLHPLIDLRLWEKTDEDASLSAPNRLVRFANEQKLLPDLGFDPSFDKLVIVFDADVFEREQPEKYRELLEAREQDNIFAVTNPSFELFLLLHLEDAYDNIILPNQQKLLESSKIGNRRFAELLLSSNAGINGKKNKKGVAELAEHVDTAIIQETQLNQDICLCMGRLTSNIAKIIDDIRHDAPQKKSKANNNNDLQSTIIDQI